MRVADEGTRPGSRACARGPRTPAIAQANGSTEEALCAQFRRAIDSIDAAARRGGSIQHMEDRRTAAASSSRSGRNSVANFSRRSSLHS